MKKQKIRNRLISNILFFTIMLGCFSQFIFVNVVAEEQTEGETPPDEETLPDFDEDDSETVDPITNKYMLKKLVFQKVFDSGYVVADPEEILSVYDSFDKLKAGVKNLKDIADGAPGDDEIGEMSEDETEQLVEEIKANLVSVMKVDSGLESTISEIQEAVENLEGVVNETDYNYFTAAVGTIKGDLDTVDSIIKGLTATNITENLASLGGVLDGAGEDDKGLKSNVEEFETKLNAVSKAAGASANDKLDLTIGGNNNDRNLELFFKINNQMYFALKYELSPTEYQEFSLKAPDKGSVDQEEFLVKYKGNEVSNGKLTLTWDIWFNAYTWELDDDNNMTNINESYSPESFYISEKEVPAGFTSDAWEDGESSSKLFDVAGEDFKATITNTFSGYNRTVFFRKKFDNVDIIKEGSKEEGDYRIDMTDLTSGAVNEEAQRFFDGTAKDMQFNVGKKAEDGTFSKMALVDNLDLSKAGTEFVIKEFNIMDKEDTTEYLWEIHYLSKTKDELTIWVQEEIDIDSFESEEYKFVGIGK